MDEKYDVIVLGTGLTECVISGLLSVAGKRVLHMDRNNYYGGESASLSLQQLYDKLRNSAKAPESFGPSRDYNVDLVPKFLMASGNLVKLLVHTGVTRYLEFVQAEGSFVTRTSTGLLSKTKTMKISKVPATSGEALRSSLFSLLEKNRMRKFLEYVQEFDEKEPKTYRGHDVHKITAADLFKDFGLEDSTQDFLGHAMALYQDDSFLKLPAISVLNKLRLYGESLARYGQSPYVYPVWGLGELPQAFARLSAIYGGTYMLNKPAEKIVYDDDGKVIGVQSEGEVARCDAVVADPSYFTDQVKHTGKVVKAICIMNHPIPNTDDNKSCQVIIPQKQLNRENDVYLFCVSSAHKVAPEGKYIAIVSTRVETNDPESELAAGLELLGPVEEKFYYVMDEYVPLHDGAKNKVFISKSYDSSTHFESTCEDILDLYKRVLGHEFDFTQEIRSGHEDDDDHAEGAEAAAAQE